jgi:hypothetical protein
MKFGYLKHINGLLRLVIRIGNSKNLFDYCLSFFFCLPIGNTTSDDYNYKIEIDFIMTFNVLHINI